MSENAQVKSVEATREMFTLNGVSYFSDSVPEESKVLFKDIAVIDQEMSKLQTSIDIAQIAKSALVDRIAGFSDNFETVPGTDTKA